MASHCLPVAHRFLLLMLNNLMITARGHFFVSRGIRLNSLLSRTSLMHGHPATATSSSNRPTRKRQRNGSIIRLNATDASLPQTSPSTFPPQAARVPKVRDASKATTSSVKQASTSASASEERGLWLIVGLGNPGAQYDKTRHNVGFVLIDELARSEGIDCRKLEKSAAVGKGEIEGQQVLLVKPVTFMNNSGESVGALARFYKVPPSRILVISDDLDQPTAAIKLKPKGGHGGHNGLRSIIERLSGSQEFPRLKIGIGRPLSPDLPVASYVLQDFTKKEKELVDVSIQEGISMIKKMLRDGLELAISSQGVK